MGLGLVPHGVGFLKNSVASAFSAAARTLHALAIQIRAELRESVFKLSKPTKSDIGSVAAAPPFPQKSPEVSSCMGLTRWSIQT